MNEPILVVANGDLRLSANRACWPAQEQVEKAVTAAIRLLGHDVQRAHSYDPEKRHGFIDSQKRGIEVFRAIPPDARSWWWRRSGSTASISCRDCCGHRAPFSPLRTGAANGRGWWDCSISTRRFERRAARLARCGAWISRIVFSRWLKPWLKGGPIDHDQSHVGPVGSGCACRGQRLGADLAETLRRDKAMLGVFDEGCMGMYNAIIPDELLQPMGVFKERLSQSALYAEMLRRQTRKRVRCTTGWSRRA